MAKRMLLMLGVMAVIILALGFVKFRQIQTAIAQGSSFAPPPEAVTTIVTKNDQWPATLSAIGNVTAVHGVTLSADLSGIVENIAFDSGRHVEAGAVLVRLDTKQEHAQLAAAEAQRDLARLNHDRSKKLVDMGAIAQADYDQVNAQYKSAEAQVGEIQATIARKTIRAPFNGVLGIRQVNLGQYLTGGDPIVPLQSLDPIYVNFSLPQQDVADLKVGQEVRVLAESIDVVRTLGKITAINSVVDEATRNVQVQATFQNPKGVLRPGMFVTVVIELGSHSAVIALPASAINYAPYGNSVYVVATMKDPKGKEYRGVQQKFVKLGGGRGDQVAVISGIGPGEEVVTTGVFKLRNGAAVVINNKVRPSNSPTPKTEDS